MIEFDLHTILDLLSILTIFSWLFVGYTTLRLYARANGNRPLIKTILFIGAVCFLVALSSFMGNFHLPNSEQIELLFGSSLIINRASLLAIPWIIYYEARRIFDKHLTH